MVRILVMLGLCLCFSWPSGKTVTLSPGLKRIVIGVDGVSREEFDYARNKLGLFKDLGFLKTHVAPFPSISDYSWNILTHSRDVFGNRGRIRTYEAAHFDRERNEVVTDPREYFRRLGEDHHYFTGAFEHWLNPFVESLLYIPTEELPKLELRQLASAIKSDPDKLVTVMVASSDALAHTRPDGSRFLVDLDAFVHELKLHYEKVNQPVEIIMVSDHGQAARFFPGENPLPLKGVSLRDSLRKAKLEVVTSLKSDHHAAVPVMALANYASVFFKDLSKRAALVNVMKEEPWFSLAVMKTESSPREVKLSIFDQSGEATLTIRKASPYDYFYEPKSSNPLGIREEGHRRWLSDINGRSLSRQSSFPDSLYRIAFSAFEEESEFPDLLFTLKDEYFLAGDLNGFTTMYQTHGSLGIRSSLGIVASTHELKSASDELRTEEILPAIGITPQELFASTHRPFTPSPRGEIATESELWDNRKIFALMNRAVQDSRYVFDGKSFDAMMDVVKPLLHHKAPEIPAAKWKETMSLGDVAHMVDLVIRNGNTETLSKDPRFLQIKAKLSLNNKSSRERSPSAESQESISPELSAKASAAKKLFMKSYSSMFFMEKALTLPETPFIEDPRKHDVRETKSLPLLFSEILKERTLLQEVMPAAFPLLWKETLPPEQMTLVYVPGIYNSLFDDEIFRSGLDRLKNKWGLRILSPKVFSTCSSSVNGKIILDELKKDYDSQVGLGRNPPSYFILGYSKGGVDALHGFTHDPEFVKNHVEGLITIASPVKGTTILNKTDLPLEVMQLLGREDAPAVCLKEEKAASSITPAAAQGFLRKNAGTLIGLTRYFSLSFVSELKNSHLFMRATKNIARFGEPNDGVVALSSSRFPESFGATDLGIVKADHLAGIVASHFPHEAFMESIVFTLERAGAFRRDQNTAYSEKLAYEAKDVKAPRHLVNLKEKISSLVAGIYQRDDLASAFRIRKTLAHTPYAVKPFSLIRKKGILHVSFSEGRWPALTGGAAVPVETEKEFYDLLLSSLQDSGRNLLKGSDKVIPESGRPPFAVPQNELGYQEDLRLDLRSLDQFIGGKRVTPVTYSTHPEGIAFIYDHASSAAFRNEYQFSFESSSPADADDNGQSGWETFLDRQNKVWAKLASSGSSVRLSTYAYRFLAKDYPDLSLEIQVNDDVENANVLLGGTGKDDSAFQLWFTFRVVDENKNREYLLPEEKVMTIGYYFGDAIPEKALNLNEIYLNYYSEKDFVVAKLPPAKQKLIGIGKSMMGVPLISRNNLLEDIRAAYPEIDGHKAEIIAITIQHDSNDTRGKSEALFRSLVLKPRHSQTVKAD